MELEPGSPMWKKSEMREQVLLRSSESFQSKPREQTGRKAIHTFSASKPRLDSFCLFRRWRWSEPEANKPLAQLPSSHSAPSAQARDLPPSALAEARGCLVARKSPCTPCYNMSLSLPWNGERCSHGISAVGSINGVPLALAVGRMLDALSVLRLTSTVLFIKENTYLSGGQLL
jgi:hypothetical protein